MNINRYIKADILSKLQNSNKAIILYGARQVGKTTLIKEIIQELGLKSLTINADEQKYIDILSSRDKNKLESLISGYEVLFIDEAQRIPEIGINTKILIDSFPNLKIILTGSSSLDLASKVKEPLTGRTWTYNLYPISFLELKEQLNDFELNEKVENYMIFGAYPDLFNLKNISDKKKYLEELTSSYLYKDILEITQIKYTNKIRNLLKLLAFQIGQEVSLSELGQKLEMSKDTVSSYIDLLEKSFVIFRLSGFNRNLRKEVTKMDKIYFYDLGVRNILINNLNFLEDRNDLGQLWENLLISERVKMMHYRNQLFNSYFWRTYTGAELDYVEEREGRLFGYEIKNNTKKITPPKAWLENYPNSTFDLINQSNYLDFITKT